MIKLNTAFIIAALCLSVPLKGWTANLALLVGVGEYPEHRLEGPVNDVRALQRMLTEKWEFKPKDITVLLNAAASRDGIIKALDALIAESRPGDNVFIYFSGHGTSKMDADIGAPLPAVSGAFIPYDVAGVKNLDELMTKLIVGRADLRPRLKRLDEGGRHIFVAIDACYSGNTVRSSTTEKGLPERFWDIAAGAGAEKEAGYPTDAGGLVSLISAKDEPYPYENLYYLAASAEYEAAQEIPTARLHEFPTFDNRPHGAFTDTLLTVLDAPAHADVDRDGQVSYAELQKTVERRMRQRRFNQTPQGLPALEQDDGELSRQAVFFLETIALGDVDKTTSSRRREDNRPPVLKVAAAAHSLTASLLKAAPNLSTVKDNADIHLSQAPRENMLEVRDRDGGLLAELAATDSEVLRQLRYRQWLLRIDAMLDANAYEFRGELQREGKSESPAVAGEVFGFRFELPRRGYLLLLDFDPQGGVTVLYPRREADNDVPFNKGVLDWPEQAKVYPPFGKDALYALLLPAKEDVLNRLAGQSFSFDHPLSEPLLDLFSQSGKRLGVSRLELRTRAE
ncbi:protein containing EF-hand calciumn-binding domain [Hahella chejuensis KCTC 2396]|uniref:Protein containing EF-hand calciumn-binding domain n=1 Tax=Hahella chejuensis (strain KCTC 2396) TaxID=349521 RepID=Q2SGU4_HAHCH|nr:caspase family protein [Hahella chejuensis]ABC30130.1 protein containing EF-hand calciumn-binding domain [Hahella chejuensis KCTC 2396]